MFLTVWCCAVIAAAGPQLSAAATARQRRQVMLQNSYPGLGPNVEVLPVGDTSGVSSSYSLVETSKLPGREPYRAAASTAHRNAGRRPDAESEYRRPDAEPEYRRAPGLGQHGPKVAPPSSGRRPFRFPEESKQRAGDEDGDDFDEPEPPRRKAKTNNRKPEAETFGESKAAPKNIKEIVEERPAESRISGDDLKDESSRFVGSGGYGGGGEYDKEKHYGKEQGQKFLEGHKSEEGEKAEKAFKKAEEFDKGQKEDYGSDEKHSQVAEKAGEKKGHVDEAQHFGEAFQGNHGEKGISVVKKGGHKKGKKTSGFHKVHHKDEYKKDEVFYDESHDGGEHEETAHEHEKHAKEKGGSEKKGHSDTGYHESHGAKKAESDHGKKYEAAKGHKSEAGEHAHHGHNSEFAKKGGVKEGEKYGHAEGGGGGYFEKGGYFD